jgi:hypothetical protein
MPVCIEYPIPLTVITTALDPVVAVVEECRYAMNHSPCEKLVTIGIIRNLGPEIAVCHALPVPLVVKLDVPPVEFVTNEIEKVTLFEVWLL